MPDAGWEPTGPALVQLAAAAGLDGIRLAQAVALVALGANRRAVSQAVTALERHRNVTRVPNPQTPAPESST